MSPPNGGYVNDVGWSYGFQWLMKNLPLIIRKLETHPIGDLTKYVIFCPGYDSVFYGWDPNAGDNVNEFGILFRTLCQNGYLALENDGHLPLGEGGDDLKPGGRLNNFDTLLLETETWPNTGDMSWQICGRLIRPYN